MLCVQIRGDFLLKASMKVPPKRKGNNQLGGKTVLALSGLNESPSEKEGKYSSNRSTKKNRHASMKVPPKRKGNNPVPDGGSIQTLASMKVPPKRKGNPVGSWVAVPFFRLNESPSEKEGKCGQGFERMDP